MKILQDGAVVDWPGTPGVSPTDPGLVSGDGLYETVRIENRTPLFWEEHLSRLAGSAEVLGMPYPDSLRMPAVGEGLQELLAASDLTHAALRIVLTRGDDRKGRSFLTLAPIPDELLGEERPILRLVAWRRASHPGPPFGGHKFLGRQIFLLAREDARKQGADEAILMDRRGHIAEGSTFNLFWVKDGVVFSPPLDMGILDGVTRTVLLRVLEEEGIRFQEVRAPLVAVLAADEVFVTSSVRELLPVSRVEDATPRRGAPGPVTRQIWTRYLERKCVKP